MPLASATAHLAADAPDYLVAIEAGRHPLTGDEGPHEGGQDRGPAPFAFVLSGLAACTAATLRMYMQRKTWPSATIAVAVSLHADHDGIQYIRRDVAVGGSLEEAQRARLAEICERTPVTLFIKRGTRIDTTLSMT
ncbi:OsmC family protein [Paraburkholderia sp. LEh10]|jgi:putative redox protein|uniref:OsmC family protein n=1 Tax=Paraburkholderia sp. LEh10 TaxID=2821353 RepID=UPI001AE51553|nr:OsmC family protein [Paraburkholderia sp. LEh10]MBP0588406.1 OsmC family protein [Paraburkholderia sp. LEh10]